jgi:hypothetical protein
VAHAVRRTRLAPLLQVLESARGTYQQGGVAVGDAVSVIQQQHDSLWIAQVYPGIHSEPGDLAVVLAGRLRAGKGQVRLHTFSNERQCRDPFLQCRSDL